VSKIVTKIAPFVLDENDQRIRKCPNRRLYCPVENRYININDVWQRVKDKRHVEIVDRKTGKDLTKEILLEIVHRLELLDVEQFTEDKLISRIRSNPNALSVTELSEAPANVSAA
jgi:polyhydroxyalkanoate synthesis regulator protein